MCQKIFIVVALALNAAGMTGCNPSTMEVIDAGAADAGSGDCATASECACTSDSDCKLTDLYRDVSSAADCYCECGCEGVANASTVQKWTEDYNQFCADYNSQPWPDGGGCACTTATCPPPPLGKCVAGECSGTNQ